MIALEASGLQDQELQRLLFRRTFREIEVRASHSQRLMRALRLIAECHEEPITLDAAARHCGVEKNHLNSLLRRATRFTFHNLLVRYRLWRAARLIYSTNSSMLEIALRSGFGSLSSMERNFAKMLGQTPMQFRARCRGVEP